MIESKCVQCQSVTRGLRTKKYCSQRCRDLHRMFPCSVCGEMMHRGATVLDPGKAAHRKCWSNRPLEHGTISAYKRGCRCEPCRAAKREELRDYFERNPGKRGGDYRRRYPNHSGTPVSPRVRQSIYERDGWVCQLCMTAVDRNLHPNNLMGPTLDHIVCQSWSQAPDHSPKNLRLAHRSCNSRRGNLRDFEIKVIASA